mmetsp:Transcript_51956/g.137225  ORF Transcript_51956/g.137225 Transcript_51956/m.137225 type:complete len:205 (-) Transcript_51956:60-674(-)
MGSELGPLSIEFALRGCKSLSLLPEPDLQDLEVLGPLLVSAGELQGLLLAGCDLPLPLRLLPLPLSVPVMEGVLLYLVVRLLRHRDVLLPPNVPLQERHALPPQPVLVPVVLAARCELRLVAGLHVALVHPQELLKASTDLELGQVVPRVDSEMRGALARAHGSLEDALHRLIVSANELGGRGLGLGGASGRRRHCRAAAARPG